MDLNVIGHVPVTRKMVSVGRREICNMKKRDNVCCALRIMCLVQIVIPSVTVTRKRNIVPREPLEQGVCGMIMEDCYRIKDGSFMPLLVPRYLW